VTTLRDVAVFATIRMSTSAPPPNLDPPETASRVPPSVLLEVSYDGTDFFGFAPQKTGRSVYDALLTALQTVDETIDDVRVASRTDARVHARGQLVAFDPTRSLPASAWQAMTNRKLPGDVVIRAAREVERGFMPRWGTLGKKYTYVIQPSSLRDPLERNRAWTIPFSVDPERMAVELSTMLGTHDFRAFRRAQDERIDTVRTMVRADIAEEGPILRVTVEGTGFMYNMVRIIVGTVVEVGAQRRAPGAIARAIETGNRSDLGMTAPPQGLCLERIYLPTDDDLPLAWTKVGKRTYPVRVAPENATASGPPQGSQA
jgi:tRNA pseudouridine38-40 synthase